MGHQNKEMDVESLQSSGRRRASCLDVFLVMSILFLFVAVAAVAVGGAILVRDLQSKVESPRALAESPPDALQQLGNTPSPAYKMQNFAYLMASSSVLQNSTMQWSQVVHGTGTSVGDNFLFDTEQNSLKPKRTGSYFIYVDLHLSCPYTCEKGILRVEVGDKLSCEVDLPEGFKPVKRKCWTVSQVEDKGLITQMTVPKEGLSNWKLDLNTSGLGMFLVD